MLNNCLEREAMAHHKNISPITALLVLSLMGFYPLPTLAQSIDVPDEENSFFEPTPIEEFSPGGEGESIPGTEPLYDKAVTITMIEVQGNRLVPTDTILNAIGTQPGSLYSKQNLQNDLRKIYDLGYFTEQIRVVPIATRDGIQLRFEVEENPVVKQFQFEGQSVLPEEDLRKLFEAQAGLPQNVNAINKGIQDIELLYKDKGYILARVEDIREEETGTVKLIISEGKINKIRYSGNRKTKDYVIRRAMAQKEGEPYNDITVTEDLKRIFSTQAFSDVRRVIKASPDAPGEYDLVIETDEKRTGAISLGGGVDTGTGIFGSVGYSDPNFLGRGENLSTVFSIGTGVIGSDRDTLDRKVTQFQASWFNPSLGETTNSLGTSFYARELGSFNVPLAIERRYGGEVTWGRPLESIPGASVSLGIGYEDTNIREGVSQSRLDEYSITPAQRQGQLTDGAFAFLSPGFSYDSRNNRFNPSQGWLSTFGSRLALGLDEDSYGTITANLRRYLKITDNVVFALNAQGGGSMFGDTPAFNMFRLGGSYTVRGFQEGGIGIGQSFLLGSAELRSKIPLLKRFSKFPIYDMLQAALFTDAGVLFKEASTNDIFNRPGYGISVGAGLRLNIPAVGPIRIDWANPIGGDSGDYVRRFNFGVGQKF